MSSLNHDVLNYAVQFFEHNELLAASFVFRELRHSLLKALYSSISLQRPHQYRRLLQTLTAHNPSVARYITAIRASSPDSKYSVDLAKELLPILRLTPHLRDVALDVWDFKDEDELRAQLTNITMLLGTRPLRSLALQLYWDQHPVEFLKPLPSVQHLVLKVHILDEWMGDAAQFVLRSSQTLRHLEIYDTLLIAVIAQAHPHHFPVLDTLVVIGESALLEDRIHLDPPSIARAFPALRTLSLPSPRKSAQLRQRWVTSAMVVLDG